ncbi:MAG: hypothetical protein H0S80_01780 [Desulfovibrionaceae bacterium]|nr:hypothetical protein [Desulfovibrionaceae bacterium]
MTFRTTINSNHRPKDFLRRGLKSMFPNYVPDPQATPPVDTEGDKKRTGEK